MISTPYRPKRPNPDALDFLMMIALAMAIALFFAGCAPKAKVVVIPSDRAITWIAPGAPNTNAFPVYGVPPARMQEILRALHTAAVDTNLPAIAQ